MARENGLTQWAITLLEAAQRAGGGDALADAHLSLLRGEAQSAADALIIIGDVAKNCNKNVQGAVKEAERAARDVVVMLCGGRVLDSATFLAVAGDAFAHRGIRRGDDENRELRAVLLLAYLSFSANHSQLDEAPRCQRRRSPRGRTLSFICQR